MFLLRHWLALSFRLRFLSLFAFIHCWCLTTILITESKFLIIYPHDKVDKWFEVFKPRCWLNFVIVTFNSKRDRELFHRPSLQRWLKYVLVRPMVHDTRMRKLSPSREIPSDVESTIFTKMVILEYKDMWKNVMWKIADSQLFEVKRRSNWICLPNVSIPKFA